MKRSTAETNLLEEQKERVLECREKLMNRHVFFGGFAALQALVFAKYVPTAGTNGKKIIFNHDYVATLNDRELYGLLVHEVGHLGLGHVFRRKNRDPMGWNIAADIALNLILVEEGINLPPKAIMRDKYKGWAAEDIYADLKENGEGEGTEGCDDLSDHPDLRPETGPPRPGGDKEGEDGGDEDGDSKGSGWEDGDENWEYPIDDRDHSGDARSDDPESSWKLIAENLSAMAKRAGQMGGALAAAVAEAKKSRIPWSSYLAALIENADTNDDVSWATPNRRYSDSEMIFPGDHLPACKDIVIMADTSGSMFYYKAMEKVAGEINGILKGRSFQKAYVMDVDARVAHVREIDPRYEEVVFEPHGGGGTSFAPGFKWLADRPHIEAACVVYLTDMEGSYGPPELIPNCPVFWVNMGPDSNGQVDPVWQSVSTVIRCDVHEL